MNPPCARCNKNVFLVEKIVYANQVWHKGCFKCTHCDLKLTMTNVKSYDKKLYCSTHYPAQKLTSVPNNAENQRLSEVTQNARNAKYHKEYNEETYNLDDNAEPVGIASRIARFDIERNNSASSSSKRMASNAKQVLPKATNERTPYEAREQSSSGMVSNAKQVLPKATNERTSYAVREQTPRYQCLFDYKAKDDDEVSFLEGDIIVKGEIIDEGWMAGTVERTGEKGMLPFDYVDKIQ